jgi:hypothetical protein
MPAMCANCPFRTDGNAIELRPGRLDGIKQAVALSQPFPCHKTTHGGAKEELECAGALAYRASLSMEQVKQIFRDLIASLPSRKRKRKKQCRTSR